MFDENKINRFEKTLEFHNRSPKVAEFWNEIADDLKDWEGFITDMQWQQMSAELKYVALVTSISNTFKLINSAKRTLNQLHNFNNYLIDNYTPGKIFYLKYVSSKDFDKASSINLLKRGEKIII